MSEKRSAEVDGLEMAFVDEGEGDLTFLLLHGNPTSSYLWRDVIPPLLPVGRCVAPDLIGMGDSAKLPDPGPDSYTFAEHRRYLDLLLDTIDLGERVVPVIHDWGSALGFDWSRRNSDRVAGIAYMEAFVQPVTWNDWPATARDIFQAFRSEAGEELILEKNLFIEGVLPASVIRDLTDEQMNEYRRPFSQPGEDRPPTLTWPRQIPIDGEPEDVVGIVTEYADWLSASQLPKLFVNAEPGTILTGGAARSVSNLAEPDRGHRAGTALHPGRQRRGNRRRSRGLGRNNSVRPVWFSTSMTLNRENSPARGDLLIGSTE